MSTIKQAVAVRPHPRQIAWQQTEFYGFIHYSPNTYTNREWGEGTEDPAIFNPDQFNANQWVEVAKSAEMGGLILTAKHHDGFCLWPSVYTDHSVASSPYHGDIVGEVAKACARGGIKFGIYCSPWDRHEPTYGDSSLYNDFFCNQLTELCSNYGELFTVWFDGACGEGPNGKRQIYDWDRYYSIIRELQPDACISVCGPDTRWCGNEAGHCRPSEWSVVPSELKDQEKIADTSQQSDDSEFRLKVDSREDDLGSIEKVAAARELVWYPAEVNTSIRPGWFYHKEEDEKVKSLDHLLDIYFGSVGGNATFLLNFPPDRRGLIHENDAERANELGNVLRRCFADDLTAGAEVTVIGSGAEVKGHEASRCVDRDEATYWTPVNGQETAELLLDLPGLRKFNVAMLQEYIAEGQRIDGISLEIGAKGDWLRVAEVTVVGYKRLLRFPTVSSSKVRLTITGSRIRPTLSRIGLFLV